jgi:low temperature requirement protein LtrA
MAELARRPWHRVMTPRQVDEEHRAATPLELFYDLCFVVAVALAADQLHHSLSEGTVAHAVRWFLLAFFGIWLAWMNFTWFASAYDTDDGPYRLTTLVQIAGALVFAAGIEPADDRADLAIVVVGFAIMRLAMVTQWLRAARFDPQHRETALRYAGGIAALRVGWAFACYYRSGGSGRRLWWWCWGSCWCPHGPSGRPAPRGTPGTSPSGTACSP